MPTGKGPLRIAIEDFIDTFGIGARVSDWLRRGLPVVEEEGKEDVLEIVNLAVETAQEIPEIADVVNRLFQPRGILGVAALGSVAVGAGQAAAGGLLTPWLRLLNYRLDRSARSARPDPATAFTLAFRTPELLDTNTDALRDLGWTEELIQAWERAIRPIVAETDLIALWRRGDLPEGELDNELIARGWPDDRIAQIKQATELRPGIQDIITQAVREAFTPDIVREFQLDAELPPVYVEEAQKLGLPREFAERFWFAHWVLPSLSQGFEMFHRLRDPASPTHFSLDDLRTLVKTQDISPFFRDRLIEIAFAPFTRVDVRRMFRDGVLNEQQVQDAYKDIGYDETKSEQLTAWTVRQARGGQKDLTRAALVSGFKKKVLSRDQAKEGLIGIGFDEMEAEFWLSLADFDIAEERADMVIDGVEFLFINGLITQSEVYDKLGPLNLPGEQVEDLLTLWNLRREAKTRIPTRGELETFYERDIITEDLFRQGLIELRYTPEQLEWYIDKSDLDIAAAAEKEAERAAREEERIQARATASEFAQTRAALSTQIAELRLNKAELTLAIKEAVDPGVKSDLKIAKAEIDVIIATLVVAKAELRQDLLAAQAP